MSRRLRREDLRKAPFRGIYTDVASELGCTPQYVLMAVWDRKVPSVIEVFLRHLRLRREAHRRAEKEFTKAIETV